MCFYRLNSLQQFNRLCLLQVTNMTRENCSGISVLSPSVFYRIPYWSWKLFFDESQSDEFLKKVEGSYGVHLWNKMSSEEKIIVGSKQAYGLLAEKYCPRVYWNCGPLFWYFSLRLCYYRYGTFEIPCFVKRITQLLTCLAWFAKLPKASYLSVLVCLRMQQLDCHFRIFIKFNIFWLFENLSQKFKFP